MAVRLAIVACAALVGVGAVTACSYSKKDADVSSASAPATVAVIPSSPSKPVVGTLPPITASSVATAATVAAPVTTAGPAAPTTAGAPPPAVTKPAPGTTQAAEKKAPATTAAPADGGTGTAVVQAGSFSTAAAAQQVVASLQSKGFGGFAVVGSAPPYKVMQGGLSHTAATALVRALAAKGVSAFSRG